MHEEVLRGQIEELAEQVGAREKLKGEVVLLVGPPPAHECVRVSADDMRTAVEVRMALGESRSVAVKQVAKELGVPRSRVYAAAHRES